MIIPIETAWPSTIPLPFIDYSGSPRNATITSPLEQAQIARRSRFSQAYAMLSVSWVLGIAEYDAFQEFFTTGLDNGASQFVIELRYPFNSELTDWIARFSGGYEAEYQDGNWVINAGLEIIHSSDTELVAPIVGYQEFHTQPFESFDGDSVQFVTSDNLIFNVRI